MSPLTRKRILRYGIAIDLVVVATGVGMLFPVPWLIATLFFAATAAAVWKGGRSGGLLAFVLSILMLLVAFPGGTGTVPLFFFVLASACMFLLPAVVERVKGRREQPEPAEEEVRLAPVEQLDAFRAESERARPEAEAREAREREDVARRRAEEEKRQRAAEARRAEEELLERERVELAAREAERVRVAKELARRETREQELQQRLLVGPAETGPPIAAEKKPVAAQQSAALPAVQRPPSASFFSKIVEWFDSVTDRRTVNMINRRVNDADRKPVSPNAACPAPPPRATRLLLVERRRATADAVALKMRQRGVEIGVVERWVDAVDEMFRFKPDAVFIDVEHPEFELIRRTIIEQSPRIPLVFTGASSSSPPAVPPQAPWLVRPYDVEELARVAQQATKRSVFPAAAPAARLAPIATNDDYAVSCFTCRTTFDAIDADWCGCLTRERTLVCTNCLTCFCKASAAYKEKFWIEAPPRLFERKTTEKRRGQTSLPVNEPATDVRRPLVLSVGDDAQAHAIVSKICSNLGYGFVFAGDGQEGLAIAREYRPDLILADAFTPKLDGREMCRILRQEPAGASCRMVVMTSLYADTKYRNEGVKRFHIDDYVAKPVAVTDLINLLQKHLENVAPMPVPDAAQPQFEASSPGDGYDVSCFRCQKVFDATSAEWCGCAELDNTLACPHCGSCFCDAPPMYKERLWIDAPPSLFERKMIGSRRSPGLRANPALTEAKRPLILLVENDESVQLIVRTVVTNMGYGFVVGADGQEGLQLAHEYEPELILSDAYMPKLDGREMCRLLKEDPRTSQSKAIIMTGLYSDRKYRNEARSHFKVDDYVAKPLAVDDLIKLLKKHLPHAVSVVN